MREDAAGSRPGSIEVHSRMKLPQFLGGFETSWRHTVTVHFNGQPTLNSNNDMLALAVLRDDANEGTDGCRGETADADGGVGDGKSARDGEGEEGGD